jgi:hypothetical protein
MRWVSERRWQLRVEITLRRIELADGCTGAQRPRARSKPSKDAGALWKEALEAEYYRMSTRRAQAEAEREELAAALNHRRAGEGGAFTCGVEAGISRARPGPVRGRH